MSSKVDVAFLVLGPLRLQVRGAQPHEPLSQHQERALAALLLDAGQAVPVDRLAAAVWTDEPPGSAGRQVHGVMTGLRDALGAAGVHDGLIQTSGDTYRLVTNECELDTLTFDATLAAARVQPETSRRRIALLRQALALWRGPALAGLDAPALTPAVAALNERRLSTWEQCLGIELVVREDAELARGLLGELTEFVATHPLRERPAQLLMLALHRQGRTAEAVDVYHSTRRRLLSELGQEPGSDLCHTHELVLRGRADSGRADGRRTDNGRGDGGRAESGRDGARADGGRIDGGLTDGRRNDGRRGDGGRNEQAALAGPSRPGFQVAHGRTGNARGGPAAAVRPAQLPGHVADFVGRFEPLVWLDALVASRTGPTIVTGAAGVGKTAMTVQWAHRARDPFPDGHLFADLAGSTAAPVGPLQVLRRFLPALGVPRGQVPHDLDDASALYRSLLDGRRMLIVLDDAGGCADQVRPLLPGGTDCATVLTSRGPLPDLVATEGARVLTINPLTAREARSLLVGRLGRDRVLAEPAAAADLIDWCAGVPLALVTVAAWIAVHPQAPLSSLADELARVSPGIGPATAADRCPLPNAV